ncbi:MAG: hypothetical protein KAR40_01815 [Candidatus Sabulitectum sp.]|nr:hypothetical protein [Candidatus Sabulitectum sp.]
MIIRIAELPVSGDWEYCIERAVRSAELSPKPDVIVLPELFSIGFALDKIAEFAVTEEYLFDHPLAQAASELGLSVVGGTFPVRTERGIINMLPVWDCDGKLIHTTEKVHLFRNLGEDSIFTGGTPSGVFEISGVTAGASVCYDLRFPELFRMHALNGARIIFLPAQWPERRIELFRSFLRARAGEAQLFFVGCNLGGDHLGVKYRGGGGVASPEGMLMKWTDADEHVRDYDIDVNEVDRVRESIACLEDRRPEIYGG